MKTIDSSPPEAAARGTPRVVVGGGWGARVQLPKTCQLVRLLIRDLQIKSFIFERLDQ